MKKIFRMALVFALAGATLMYTGCTKDYDEEINGLDTRLTSLESNYSQTVAGLQSEVSSVKSSLSSLESAYKAADAALQKTVDSSVSAVKELLQSTLADATEDMTSLNNKAAAAEAALALLQADLANYATKDELNAAKTDLEGKIAAEKKALEEKIAADKADLEAKIDAAKTEILAKTEALDKRVSALESALKADEAAIKANAEAIALLQAASGNITDVYTALTNELRSIVFVPELYYAGIEAAEYTYAIIDPLLLEAYDKEYVEEEEYFWNDDKEEYDYVTITYPKGQVYDSDWNPGIEVDEDVYDWYIYSIGQQGALTYNLNPSTFDASKATWSLEGKDYDYVVRAALPEPREAVWEPVVLGATTKDGNVSVSYSINNAEHLSGLVESYYLSVMEYIQTADLRFKAPQSEMLQTVQEALEACSGTVSIVNLVADLGDGKTVESDYEAILANPEFLAHLAFDSKSAYYTKIPECYTIDPLVGRALYNTLEGAVKEAYSVDVLYNGGSVDLAQYIKIHVGSNYEGNDPDEKELTLAELNKLYGDRFSYEFSIAQYTVGDNVTPENAYGAITKAGVFTPQYVISNTADGTWKSAACPKGELTGISSVGRYPIVMVTLYDGENVVLNGFFKTKIVKEIKKVEPKNTEIVIPNLGTVPYLCVGTEVATNWHQFSSLVLEATSKDYNDFIDYYEPETEGDYMVVYVKNDKGAYVAADPNDLYGTVVYGLDNLGSGVNNAFTWVVDAMEIGAGKSQSIYVHMADESGLDNLWIELSASVSEKGGATFGVKNPAYWFDDIEDEVAANTVRANVLVPNATEDDVTVFTKKLDDYFVGNKLQVVFDEESASYATDAELTYSYQFSAVQPEIVCEEQGVKELLVANKAQNILFVALKDAKGYVAYDKTLHAGLEEATGKYVVNQFADIAKLEPTGKLTYTYAEGETVSKTLLNLWGKEETDNAKILYCNVDVLASYGDCEIPAGDIAFHVRFIRPVSAFKNEAGKLVDAVPGGSEVALGKILAAKDWQNFSIFSVVAADAKAKTAEYFAPGTYTTVAGTVIDWFTYYGFNKIAIDFDNVKTNQTGEWKLLSEVNPAAILELYKDNQEVESGEAELAVEKDYDISVAQDGSKTADAIPALADYKLHYENNMGVVKDFQLSVPVVLTYAWGTLTYDAVIEVAETYTKK